MRMIKSEVYFPIIVGVHLVLWAVDLALYEGSWALVEGESPIQRVLGEIMSSWVITVFGFNLFGDALVDIMDIREDTLK